MRTSVCFVKVKVHNLIYALILLYLPGPFAPCHDYQDPADYYSSCLYDVCETGDPGHCASLEQYAQACKNKGGNPDSWRDIVTECRE